MAETDGFESDQSAQNHFDIDEQIVKQEIQSSTRQRSVTARVSESPTRRHSSSESEMDGKWSSLFLFINTNRNYISESHIDPLSTMNSSSTTQEPTKDNNKRIVGKAPSREQKEFLINYLLKRPNFARGE